MSRLICGWIYLQGRNADSGRASVMQVWSNSKKHCYSRSDIFQKTTVFSSNDEEWRMKKNWKWSKRSCCTHTRFTFWNAVQAFIWVESVENYCEDLVNIVVRRKKHGFWWWYWVSMHLLDIWTQNLEKVCKDLH